MNFRIINLIVLFSFLNCNSNLDLQSINGTFIYGAVCNDGVIFVSDSRANFNDGGESKFFIDDVKKLFIVSDFIIGFTGEIRIGDKFPESYLKKIDSMNINSPIDLIIKYNKVLRRELGDKAYESQIKDFNILAGGFDKKRKMPLICGLQEGKIHFNNRGTITNHKFSRSHLDFSKKSFSKSKDLMRRDISKFVRKNNLFFEIGGNITVITSQKDKKPKCIQHCNQLTWGSWKEMKTYMMGNLNKLNLTNAKTHEEALMVLRKYK